MKIRIKKKNRGTFTAAATKHGKSVQEFARQVLANKENYSPAMVKKAVFAHNSAKWHRHAGDSEESSYLRTKEKSAHPFIYSMLSSSMGQADNPMLTAINMLVNKYSKEPVVYTGSFYFGDKYGYGTEKNVPTNRNLVDLYVNGNEENFKRIYNPAPIVLDGDTLNHRQYEGTILPQDTIYLRPESKSTISRMTESKALLPINNSYPGFMSYSQKYNFLDSPYFLDRYYGKTIDDANNAQISFKKDTKGNYYADVFDLWDLKGTDDLGIGNYIENQLVTDTIENNGPFIIRQKVPIVFNRDSVSDGNFLNTISAKRWEKELDKDKHSTGGPLYPFSFQKNPYLKVPVVRYDEGGKKTEGSVARNFGSHKGANGLYLDTNTNIRTYDGDGLTPVSVFFNQEYSKGMDITNFDKQQQLFNWYESERQKMGNAFSVEDASKWAHNIATQHIYPEFILPTMTVVASKNKKKGNELQEKHLTQNVESPIIESTPVIESNFVVGNGPKWEDSFRERQLGKGFDTYGRMLSDTVPAINVPELVRMSEDWYNKITDAYPEITEEEVLGALNDMKYVRAGAYTGPAGMMHSGHWAWFDPYTNTLTSSGGSTDAHELEHALREKVLGNSGKATDEEKKILKTMFPTLNTKTHYTFGNHDVSEMLALNNEVREALRIKLGYSTTKDLIKDLSDNTKITDDQLAEILEETLESSAYIPTTEDVYRSITRKEAPMKDFQYWVNEFYDPDFIKYYDISKDGKIDDIEHIDSSNKGYLQHPFYESILSIIPTLYDENTANTLLKDLKSKQKSYTEQFIQSNGEEKVYTRPYFKALEEIKLKWYNEHIEDILKDFIKKSENYKKPSYNINKQQQEKIDAARKALKIIAGIEPNIQQNIV